MSSDVSESSFEGSDVQETDVDDEEKHYNFNDESGSPISVTETDVFRTIHDFGDMGFNMDVVLDAIIEVKTLDKQTVLNNILFKGILSNPLSFNRIICNLISTSILEHFLHKHNKYKNACYRAKDEK